MASNVINRPINVVAKLNTIAKIRKYKGFHEGHHFIPMAMELHNTHPSMIWIISLGNVPIFSMVDDWKVIYPCLFAFNFSSSVLVFDF